MLCGHSHDVPGTAPILRPRQARAVNRDSPLSIFRGGERRCCLAVGMGPAAPGEEGKAGKREIRH